jgi:hypothetical protein
MTRYTGCPASSHSPECFSRSTTIPVRGARSFRRSIFCQRGCFPEALNCQVGDSQLGPSFSHRECQSLYGDLLLFHGKLLAASSHGIQLLLQLCGFMFENTLIIRGGQFGEFLIGDAGTEFFLGRQRTIEVSSMQIAFFF